jgi:Spy/CpxP family protein refolding chaperone
VINGQSTATIGQTKIVGASQHGFNTNITRTGSLSKFAQFAATSSFAYTIQNADRGGETAADLGEKSEGFEERLYRELQLSFLQWGRIKALHEKGGRDAQPLLEQMRQLRLRMRAVSESGAFDEAAARALAARSARLEFEFTVLIARTESAIYQVFTPEQKSKLAALRQQCNQCHYETRVV